MITVGNVCAYLDSFAPPALAADWDNVGLLLGDPACAVRQVMTCLTVTDAVVAEALAEGVGLIVAHHPILFRGAKKLSIDSPDGRLVWPLARAGVAVYSPHTSFDNCVGGINDCLAAMFGLLEVKPLRPQGERRFKVAIFTPDADLAKVSEAVFAAGAGIIGQYSHCSYRSAGTGTFFGSTDANPTIGKTGRLEEVSEWRLEVVCPAAGLDRVIAAIRQAHSYEEPAFDVYPLHDRPGSAGEGRLGRLPVPIRLSELASTAKKMLNAGGMQIVGDSAALVANVAIACGAAGEFLGDARRAGADVFLTGEMRFHDYLTAQSQRLALLLPGHYASERPAVEMLADRLSQQFPTVPCWCSRREADPVVWLC